MLKIILTLFCLVLLNDLYAQTISSEIRELAQINSSVIIVSNIEELEASIAPGKTIYLESGDYITQKGTLKISGTDSLTLIGEINTRILAAERNVTVFSVQSSNNLKLENLIIGYTANEEKEGKKELVMITSSGNITLNNCQLFGPGSIGLKTANVENLVFTNSSIFNCTFRTMQLVNTTDVTISNSKFHHNSSGPGGLIQFHGYSWRILFDGCEIYNNTCKSYELEASPQVFGFGPDVQFAELKNCLIHDNKEIGSVEKQFWKDTFKISNTKEYNNSPPSYY